MSREIVPQGQVGQAHSDNRVGVFAVDDIQRFFELLRSGRQVGRAHSTRFTNVEDFILDTRRTSRLTIDLNQIDINDVSDNNAMLMRTWLGQVAPSCVYRYRSGDFGQTLFYRCCFTSCLRPVSSQFALMRHYREQHYNQIPEGIFGVLQVFKCIACATEFKREDHLKLHYQSVSHITQMAILGNSNIYFVLL